MNLLVRILATSILVGSVLFAPQAMARRERSTLTHTAKTGDTLPLLAAEYYGDRKFAVFIMVANGLKHPRDLRNREKLKIPTAWKYHAIAGESLESLAKRFLGDVRRAPFLADFNNLPTDETLATGQEVMIPFHVTHVAQAATRLTSLAATFYGSAKRASLIQGYNFLNSDTVRKGRKLTIPITHVRISESRLPSPETSNQVHKRQEMEERARRALPEAREAWSSGEYGQVKKLLADLEVDYLNSRVAAEAAFLLGSAYVAFDDEDSAVVQFKKVLQRRPKLKPSKRDVSPKILAIWEAAGGRSNK